MAIQFGDDRLSVEIAAFEVRYAEGYRYLDRCGEAIVQVQKYDPNYLVANVNPQSGQIINNDKKISFSFGYERLNIEHQGTFSISESRKTCEVFGKDCEHLYNIITGTISVTKTLRVGVRYRFSAEAGSLEESDKFILKSSKSLISDWLVSSSWAGSLDLRDCQLIYVLEDSGVGLKRRVEVGSAVEVRRGAAEYNETGDITGKAKVYVDVDTYTRPAEGHFEKASVHVQNSFIASHAIAKGLFQSMSTHQGN